MGIILVKKKLDLLLNISLAIKKYGLIKYRKIKNMYISCKDF